MARTSSQRSRYLGARKLCGFGQCVLVTRRGESFALALKIKGQKDRIGPVVGIADERNNVSQGEEVGQGGAVFWRSQPGWEED